MFLQMLSYHISWHMEHALAPILHHDHDKPAPAATRPSPVAAAQRSDAALAKPPANMNRPGVSGH